MTKRTYKVMIIQDNDIPRVYEEYTQQNLALAKMNHLDKLGFFAYIIIDPAVRLKPKASSYRTLLS